MAPRTSKNSTKVGAAKTLVSPNLPRVKRSRTKESLQGDDDVVIVDDDSENSKSKRLKKADGHQHKEAKVPEHFTTERCLAWFRSYATSKTVPGAKNSRGKAKTTVEYVLESNGMEKFYGAIGVNSSDIMALIVSQKLGVTSLEGTVSSEQWLTLMTSISCDSDAKFKSHLAHFLAESRSRPNLLRLCDYVFSLVRKPGEKVISKGVATELFSMMLKSTWTDVFPFFAKFLDSIEVRSVSLDTFGGICDIAANFPTVKSLQKYDATWAWPSLADDFVEWLKVNTPTTDEPMQAE